MIGQTKDSDMKDKITIGADPELFVKNSKTKEFVSAHDLFPGTKYDPAYTAKGAIQVDGVAAEFNITPAEEVDDFLENISHTTNLMKMAIRDRPELTLVAEPVAMFEKEYFEALPVDVKALGCSPDWNAWTCKTNPSPRTTEPFRTGAGHIHLGWTEDENEFAETHFRDCVEITKQLDSILYVSSHAWDQDRKRRTLYGKMGSFRPKKYGCEYRALSNVWVSDPEIAEWIFNATKTAHEQLVIGNRMYEDQRFLQMSQYENIGFKDAVKFTQYMSSYYGTPELPQFYREM